MTPRQQLFQVFDLAVIERICKDNPDYLKRLICRYGKLMSTVINVETRLSPETGSARRAIQRLKLNIEKEKLCMTD